MLHFAGVDPAQSSGAPLGESSTVSMPTGKRLCPLFLLNIRPEEGTCPLNSKLDREKDVISNSGRTKKWSGLAGRGTKGRPKE